MENYYIIYQIGFDEFNIEINYIGYESCMHVQKYFDLSLDESNMNKLIDMLDSLGFEDRSGDTEDEE